MFSMLATTSAEKIGVQSGGAQQECVSGFCLLETNEQKIEGERALLDWTFLFLGFATQLILSAVELRMSRSSKVVSLGKDLAARHYTLDLRLQPQFQGVSVPITLSLWCNAMTLATSLIHNNTPLNADIIIYWWIYNTLMVHSHLMLSQLLNENLCDILGGTQC